MQKDSAHLDKPTETSTDTSLKAAEPVDMILHCPTCGLQHVDAPDEAADRDDPDYHCPPRWTNPPHRSHLCHGCGHIWRPADVPTNGVATIKTKGKNDRPAGPMDVNSKAEPVAYAAKEYRTGKFGYIWHEKEDVQGWINLQHQMQDSITWLGPIALCTVPTPALNINAVWDAIAEYCWTYHEAMVPVVRPDAEQAYRAAGRALKALIGDRTDHDEVQSGIKPDLPPAK